MKKYIIILSILVGGIANVNGQQELMVSQYMFNGLILNPAYAGTHSYTQASILHRSQWVGMEDTPISQVLSIDAPFANEKLGLGLYITNDQLGIEKQLEIGANFAYHLNLGAGKLSFGLSAQGSSYNADVASLTVWDDNDQVYDNTSLSNEFVTKFGFGIYYHKDLFYAGLSIPTILSLDKDLLPNNSSFESYFDQHYYLNMGFVIESSYNLAIKPSILVKYLPEAPAELDINCNFLFFQKFWLGAGYRTNDALIGMLEYNITPQLRLGYAYDFTLTDINTYSNGSHEIMIGYDFGKDILTKKRSIRYF